MVLSTAVTNPALSLAANTNTVNAGSTISTATNSGQQAAALCNGVMRNLTYSNAVSNQNASRGSNYPFHHHHHQYLTSSGTVASGSSGGLVGRQVAAAVAAAANYHEPSVVHSSVTAAHAHFIPVHNSASFTGTNIESSSLRQVGSL